MNRMRILCDSDYKSGGRKSCFSIVPASEKKNRLEIDCSRAATNQQGHFKILARAQKLIGPTLMEGSESEAIFDSLNLNPKLFINAARGIVDDLIDEAFDHLHHEASTQLEIDGSEDRAEDLTTGLDSIRNAIQFASDNRMSYWEKYCLRYIFQVPEGFSLPKDDEASGDDIMDVDVIGNSDLDEQLDSLRTKLTLAEQESVELKREIEALEKQSVISNHNAESINELKKLSQQISENDVLQEMQKVATELRIKMEKIAEKRTNGVQRATLEKMHLSNGDMLRIIGGNGLSNLNLEEIDGFLACMKPI